MSENTDTARPNPDAHLLPRPERGWLGLILRGMPDVDASALDLGADERHPGTWWYGSLAALVPWFLSAVFLVLVGTVAPLLAISPIDLITKGERSGGGLATSVIGFVSLLLAILAVLFEVCPTPRRARATSFGFMLEREALFTFGAEDWTPRQRLGVTLQAGISRPLLVIILPVLFVELALIGALCLAVYRHAYRTTGESTDALMSVASFHTTLRSSVNWLCATALMLLGLGALLPLVMA